MTEALAHPGDRILITTYTNENLAQIRARISSKSGRIPENVTIMSWYSFLISQCARPYQHAVVNQVGLIRALNFVGARSRFIPRSDPTRFYLDRNGDMYRDCVSDFACQADQASGGLVIKRLEVATDQQPIDGAGSGRCDLGFSTSCSRARSRQSSLAIHDNTRSPPTKGPRISSIEASALPVAHGASFDHACSRRNKLPMQPSHLRFYPMHSSRSPAAQSILWRLGTWNFHNQTIWTSRCASRFGPVINFATVGRQTHSAALRSTSAWPRAVPRGAHLSNAAHGYLL